MPLIKSTIPEDITSKETLVKVLSNHINQTPNRVIYRFLENGEEESDRRTYQDLYDNAKRIASHILEYAKPGDRVLLLYPSGLDFMDGFLGCLLAGVIAVPAFPPQGKRRIGRLENIVADCKATLILTIDSIYAKSISWFDNEIFANVKWLQTNVLIHSLDKDFPVVMPGDTAFLQYTSGSTGDPKGVMVTHANIIHNNKLMKNCFHQNSETIGVSWLPIYHDMGLIGNILQALYVGFEMIIMPPTAFIQKPVRWLKVISSYQATFSGGPNFSYDLCVNQVKEEDLKGLDLSSWQVAYNGSEPIRPETINNFITSFSFIGFGKMNLIPCYGMAETTLIISCSIFNSIPKALLLDKESFHSGKVKIFHKEAEIANVIEFIGNGIVLEELKIKIVNPDTKMICQENEIGEIWISGASVAKGYWQREELTKDFFQARIQNSDANFDEDEIEYLRTGDMGFVNDKELYITGRLKELMIINGVNHFPQDIERVVQQSHIDLQNNAGAAFCVESKGKEQLVIVQEIKRTSMKEYDFDFIVKSIIDSVFEQHELSIYAIILVEPGKVDKTSSGKIKRLATKTLYESNTIDGVMDQWVRGQNINSYHENLQENNILKPTILSNDLEKFLREALAAELNINILKVKAHTSFSELGMSSIHIIRLIGKIRKEYGVELPIRKMFEDLTNINAIIKYIIQETGQIEALSSKFTKTPVKEVIKNNTIDITDFTIIRDLFAEQNRILAQQNHIISEFLNTSKTSENTDKHITRETIAEVSETTNIFDTVNKKITAKEKIGLPGSFGSEKFYFQKLPKNQEEQLSQLIESYTARTRKSKSFAIKHKAVLADYHSAYKFNIATKEMVYPILSEHASGSHFTDIDGNKYIDIVMGFGSCIFGHQPEFISKAILERYNQGMVIDPINKLSGDIAGLVSKLTGAERVCLTNTGTEAVSFALRIARAVTGKSKIVVFSASFHGHGEIIPGVQENVVESLSAGIRANVVKDLIILNYSDDDIVEQIRAHKEDLAGIFVEPVRSRFPDFQPKELLHQLSKLSKELDIPFIFDEMVTGFRIMPGGAQEYFDIKADIVIYGEISGGGMPIGIVAGSSKYLDAVDSGHLHFGDESYPQVDKSFTAGTFTRHPLTLAASKAVLTRIHEIGKEAYLELNNRTASLMNRLNSYFERESLPIMMVYFGSLFSFRYKANFELLAFYLMQRGIYVWESNNLFLSFAHSDEDIEELYKGIKECVKLVYASSDLSQENVMLQGVTDDVQESNISMVNLTLTQQKFNLLHQIDSERSLAYTQSFSLQMKGKIYVSLLKMAICNLIDSHSILRTRVSADGEHLIFDPSISLPIEEIDISKDGSDQQEEAYEALVDENMRTAFSFTNGPFVRLQLIKFSSDRHTLVVTMHHIIADGWSCALFIKGIVDNYNSLFQGKKLDLLQPVGFNEYTKWLENKLNSDDWKIHEDYFINKFSKKSFYITLPFDNSLVKYGNASNSVSLRISKENILRYRKWSGQQNLTLFMTFLSAFELLLSKICEKEELIIGIPAGGRTMPDIEETIGDFSHFMLFLTSHNSKDSLTAYVKDLKNRIYEAYEHQEYPYANFMELLQKETDIKYDNWVNVIFNFNVGVSDNDMESIDLHIVHNKPVYSDFDLMFNAIEESGDLVISLDYRESFLNNELAKDILDSYQFILNQLIENDGGTIEDIQLLSESRKEQQLQHFNDTGVFYPKDKTIVNLFEEQVLRMPDSIAVVFGKEELTYKELDEKSNQVAHYLIHKGLKPEDLVGICVDRSFDMIIAVFGVLKAGGTYVPIDAEYPEDRIHYIIKDSNATFFITDHVHKLLVAENKSIQVITTDDRWMSIGEQPLNKVDAIVNAGQSVYVIYTSGSTGKPKGVVINHESLLNMALCWESSYHLDSDTCLLQLASFSFDVFSGDLCRSLLFGGRMILCPSDVKLDPARLYDLILEKGVTILEGTPGLVIPLMDYIYEQSLDYSWMKLLILGSDLCSMNDFKRVYIRFGHAMRIINSYGTTETTIDSSYFETGHVESLDGLINVPVGKPLWNNSFYILNTSESLLPIGVIGELCIGGAGVARGYLNQEELTREKFVANPFKEGERMYKTGDLARWLPDGNLEFIGRKDDQVKIRGYRIELGEIENALSLLSGITQCCVLAREDVNGIKRLVGYVVLEGALDKERLQNQLKLSLPEYMIPMIWIALDVMPLTSNGKLDKKGLPDPDSSSLSSKEYAGPATDIELQLVNIWQELLGVGKVGIHDDFFELGGHSLLATRLVSIIRKELMIEISIREIFMYTTVCKLGTYVSAQSEGILLPAIVMQARPARIPLSFSQERLWFLDKLQGSTDYHLPTVLRLEGSLDVSVLEQTLQEIVSRHEVLRSVLLSEDGIGYQEIISAEGWSLDKAIVSDELVLGSNIADYLKKPFDLAKDYKLRCCLYDLGDGKYVLASVFHHIASDGWSGGVLVNEFMKLYHTLQSDRTAILPKLSLQYADYAIWQRKYVADTVLEEQLSYWEEKLQDVSTLLLPTDYARPPVHSTNGACISFVLDKTLSVSLKSLCRSEGVTLFMFLLSAFKVLLSRYSGQSDVCVGTPIANRTQLELEDMIGFFVNTIALRSDLSGDPGFRDLLAMVKQTTLDGYDNQLAPFEKVVDRVVTTRDMAISPLFQVLFVLQNTPDAYRELDLKDITISNYSFDTVTSQFDLMLNVFEDNNGISLDMSYCTDLFDKKTIDRMLMHYQQLLVSIVNNITQPIGSLSMISAQEEHQLLNTFNDTIFACPKDKTIIDLFKEQVSKTPEAIAMVYQGEELSYRDLDERSNQLVHYLKSAGAVKDSRIAILFNRSFDMITGMLGILKSGCTYVPLDPLLPANRLSYILEDSSVNYLLYNEESLLSELAVSEYTLLNTAESYHYETSESLDQREPDSVAYIMYTSGTTGLPKGILISDENIITLINDPSSKISVEASDRVLQWSNYAFDGSTYEIFGGLLSGASLYLIDNLTASDAGALAQVINKNELSIVFITTALFNSLTEYDLSLLSSLRLLLFGGEKVSVPPVRKMLAALGRNKILHVYGPTETTVYATCYVISDIPDHADTIPIGKPLTNTSLYVLNSNQQLVPVGVIGELYIGGTGVAKGYLNQVELTNEKFITNPFITGEVIYRTGDLARWLPDGNIEFVGRGDDQVKIRGYRIELSEIENVLLSLGLVIQCRVLVKVDLSGNKRLVGYVVLEGVLDKEKIQEQLKSVLPEYMVPQLWVELDTIPLTSNGKLDKKALPEFDGSQLSAQVYVAPRNETESQLVAIWESLLGVTKIGIHDNFFELGGHSLLVVQLMSRLQVLDFHILVKDIFAGPTIASIHDKLSSISLVYTVPANGILATSDPITPAMVPLLDFDQSDLDKIVAMVPGGVSNIEDIYPLSPLQEGIYFHHLLSDAVQGDPYVLSSLLSFSDSNKRTAFIEALQFVVNRHDILRTCFLSAGLPGVVQVVLREAVLPVELLDSSGLDNSKAILPQLELLVASGTHWMDTSKAPLLELKLADDPEHESYYLIVYDHHIIMDHVGLEKVIEEVMLYLSGEVKNLLVPFLYRDFIGHTLHTQSVNDGESYFRSLLGTINEPTYPFNLSNASGDGTKIEESAVILSKDLSTALRNTCVNLSMSPAVLFHAAFGLVIARCCNKQYAVFGSLFSGRLQGSLGAADSLGLFINTLPVALELKGSVREYLDEVKLRLGQLLSYEQTPLSHIHDWSGISNQMALFSALLNYRHSSSSLAEENNIKDLGITLIGDYERTNYPFNFIIDDFGVDFGLTVLVDESIGANRILEFMEQSLIQLIDGVNLEKEVSVNTLNILCNKELHQLLDVFNDTATLYPKDKTVVDLFQEQARRSPDAVALVHEVKSLTYRELDERSNQLVHYLKSMGVTSGSRIAILFDKRFEMIISMLGILKSGCTYVPLDASIPSNRLTYILEDSGVNFLLYSEDSLLSKLSVSEFIFLLDITESSAYESSAISYEITPASVAYVMYTSGTTGNPKGVMVTHGNIVSLCTSCDYTALNSDTVWLSTGSLAFDATTLEFWGTLLNGGQLVLADTNSLLAVKSLKELILRHKVTTMWMTASWFHQVVEEDSSVFGPLVSLLVGGDVVLFNYTNKLKELYPDLQLINGYGPTENTTFSTTYSIDKITEKALPIGKPIKNSHVYITDAELNLVPVGVTGEICVGGSGVALGYLNQEELTREKFINDPFKAGERIYKTGDLGRWLPDGNIEFTGRKDDQVKIRGYRIELGEIEHVLLSLPGVTACCVLAKEDINGTKSLVGYVVLDDTLDKEALQEQLKQSLPEYMVPMIWVALAVMPLTSNGKLDKKSLPDPDGSELSGKAYAAPRNETEAQLAVIWQEILGVDRIGIHDNFFELGGHSLLATRLVSMIRKEWSIEIEIADVFTYTTISEFRIRMSEQSKGILLPTIVAEDRPVRIPLSFSQERLWFLDELQGTTEYHLPIVLRLEGTIAISILEQTLKGIVSRHEVLRSMLLSEDGISYQEVISPENWCLDHLNITDETKLNSSLEDYLMRPFDLSKDYKLRSCLYGLGNNQYVLASVFHHIASDGWSRGILINEFMELYSAFQSNRTPDLPVLNLQYADYAIWQRKYLEGRFLENQLSYWEEKLQGVSTLSLPTDYVRPLLHNNAGATVSFKLEKDLSSSIRSMCQEEGVTLFMLLLAVFKVLLSRYSGQEDICVGSPIANRTHSELEGMIGFFVNTLAFRSDLSGDPGFRDLLARVKQTTLEGYNHQLAPFEKVVDRVVTTRDMNMKPLFQVMFVLQNAPETNKELDLENIKISDYDFDRVTSQFDLIMDVSDIKEVIYFNLEYSTALFDQSTIIRIQEHYQELLKSVLSDATQSISSLSMLTKQEEHQLLAVFNDTDAVYPKDKTLIDLFEEQVKRTPDAIAIVYEGKSISYKELNKRSNQLGRYLQKQNIGSGNLIAICLERSLEMLIGMLGILKSGRAYLPIDPESPAGRIDYMLNDAGIELVLSSSSSAIVIKEREGVSVLSLDSDWDLIAGYSTRKLSNICSPDHQAYTMYTSGTTGNPKGVMVTHGNIVSLCTSCDYTALNSDTVWLSTGSIAFDATTLEFWGTLLNGGQLVLADTNSLLEIKSLKDLILQHKVTTMWMTASWFHQVVEEDSSVFAPLTSLLVGGDVVLFNYTNKLKELYPDLQLINGYGPTENTTFSTTYRIDKITEKALPIGKPIKNSSVYITDPELNLVPAGVTGEICVGGSGVALGYLNQEELTGEKFINDPFKAGERIYKTGDLGRWLPDGNIEFIGRKDDQVKIRGYRIELGEIEHVLSSLPGVTSCCVLAKEDVNGTRSLVGYVVLEDELDKEALQEQLKLRLPEYMVPVIWVELAMMPLTSNGKLDKKSLPDPDGSALSSKAYVAPRNETEAQLAIIWQELLGIDQVGIHDNFFELGGHSLLATRLVSMIRKELSLEVSIRNIFRFNTIEELGSYITYKVLNSDDIKDEYSINIEL